MSRVEAIHQILRSLAARTSDVQAAALVDDHGRLVASSFPTHLDPERVAALSSDLLGLSERFVAAVDRGPIELILLRGPTGYSVLVRSGSGNVLTVLAAKDARLGAVFLDTQRSAEEIGRLMA